MSVRGARGGFSPPSRCPRAERRSGEKMKSIINALKKEGKPLTSSLRAATFLSASVKIQLRGKIRGEKEFLGHREERSVGGSALR